MTGLDGQLYLKRFSAGILFNNWEVLNGGFTGQPVCTIFDGTLYVLARASDGANILWLMNRPYPNGTWTFVDLRGSSPSTPVLLPTSVTGTGPYCCDRLDIIARGGDNKLWHLVTMNGYPFNGWETAEGQTTDAPAAVDDGLGLYLVVRGSDNSVWYNSVNVSTVACLPQLSSVSTCWTGWVYLKGGTTSAPAITQDSTGTVHIVVTGLNGGIYHDTKPVSGLPGTTWDEASGGLSADEPAVSRISGNTILVLVRGTDNGLYFNTLSGTSWGTWRSAGGATTVVPTLTHF